MRFSVERSTQSAEYLLETEIRNTCNQTYEKLAGLFRFPEEKIKSLAICETVADVLCSELKIKFPDLRVKKMRGTRGPANHFFLEIGEGKDVTILDASWTQFVSDPKNHDSILYVKKSDLQEGELYHGIPHSLWLRTSVVPVKAYNL